MNDASKRHAGDDGRRCAAGQPDEMYVGYLPVPRRQAQFIRLLVPAAMAMLATIGWLWARSQASPGRGVWENDRLIQLRGVLIARPYPMLLTTREDGGQELVLLVERGKRGPRHAEAQFGRSVAASGSLLVRDGRRMLELQTGDNALAPAASTGEPFVPPRKSMGPVTLRGEIIDAKCFLGAMKPGEGKTHKECATLCIRGGIPPLFITHDGAGRAVYCVLEAPDGGPAGPEIQPFIADPVEISGEWSTWAGMNFLSVRAGNITRL